MLGHINPTLSILIPSGMIITVIMPATHTTNQRVEFDRSARFFPGDHIGKVTPVPIPNTVVKLSEPMIVPTSVKVGIAGIFSKPFCFGNGAFLFDLPAHRPILAWWNSR